jgi:hypothetical protein
MKNKKLKPKNPHYYIYSYWAGGWFAYNDKTRERFHLTYKTFDEAVSIFQKKTGHEWYGEDQN